ncbi:ribbon-helix-helix protein, CopG family [Brevibacterium salitolerans]|uniref:ribbon-helix-helix protein, CopG family n=1 Tax=Brevibacterium salitolerans TaxID=1403566 RepID=UPI0031DDF16E
MRTTVNLPDDIDARVRALAEERGQSVSAVLVDLAARGLEQLSRPIEIRYSEVSGTPCMDLGRRVTSEEVAELIEED